MKDKIEEIERFLNPIRGVDDGPMTYEEMDKGLDYLRWAIEKLKRRGILLEKVPIPPDIRIEPWEDEDFILNIGGRIAGHLVHKMEADIIKQWLGQSVKGLELRRDWPLDGAQRDRLFIELKR